jgi:U3 small nucleolar RNA-associated protein 12
LEEERERELEELYDSNLNDRGDRDALKVTSANGVDGDEATGESTEVTKSTTETLMAGERIIEALEVSEADQEATREYEREVASYSDPKQQARVPAPSRNPVFSMYGGCGPHEYVLKVVRQIPAASLHDALLVLPFSKVAQLIEHLDVWARHAWQITLTSRVLFFLLRTHHSQIVATRALRQTMLSLRGHLRDALKRQKVSSRCEAFLECKEEGLNHVNCG